MSLERRVWQLGTLSIVLLLILSCRLAYWYLPREAVFGLAIPGGSIADADWSAPQETDTPGTQATPTTRAAPDLSTPIPATVPQSTITKQPTRAAGPTRRPTRTPTPTIAPTPTLDLATLPRGTIHDRNGRRLAYDLQGEGGNRIRFYTEPSLAHVVGYLSGLRIGVAGIERAFDRTLLGLKDTQDVILPGGGNDVYLTIDSRVQRAAAQALEGKAGAIVVLDTSNGAVLAMASTPAFDPNRILELDYLRQLEQCAGAITCRHALLNRAAQGSYTPGSTWKTITLIAALESGQVTAQTEFDFGPPLRDEKGRIYYVYTVDGFPIRDPNHQEQRLDLARSYALSANAAFARIGYEMPAEHMIEYAARFGFGRADGAAPPIEIDASTARLAIDPQSLRTNNVLRASTAIGQGELLASPLSMALVMMAVVRDGDIPNPHLLQSVRDRSGRILAGEPGGYWGQQTMRPETARQVHDWMVYVVQSGTGSAAAVPGCVVGGKTGTAQLAGDANPHAWFTGFAQRGERTVAIVVIVEEGGSGSQAAAPLFARVADVAMHHLGEPVDEIVPEPPAK